MDLKRTQKKELVQALQALRTAYESLEQEVPFDSLKDEDFAVHPNSEHLLGLIKEIFLITRKLADITNRLISVDNRFMIVLSDQDKQYLDEVIYPRFDVIRQAYFAYHPDSWLHKLLWSSNDGPADDSNNDIFQTISAALYYWDFTIDEDDDRRHEEFNFSGAVDIVNSSFFKPDDWKKNLDALKPVIQGERDPLIPKDVRKRLESTYLSFTFGNWLACCAQARATLEYSIRSIIGQDRIRKTVNENQGDTNLHMLIENIARGEFEHLKDPMERVRTRGNAVMHPTGESRLTNPDKDSALKVVEDLHSVVECLFTKKKFF